MPAYLPVAMTIFHVPVLHYLQCAISKFACLSRTTRKRTLIIKSYGVPQEILDKICHKLSEVLASKKEIVDNLNHKVPYLG